MKKIFLTTLCLLCAFYVNAQWYIGPQASLNLCSITKATDGKTYPGFAVGAFGGYDISDAFAIEAHLMLSTQGVKATATDYNATANIKNTYINLPILAKFNIYEGIYGYLGPQIGMRVGSKMIGDGLKISTGESFKAFDFGLLFGAGYQFDFGLRAGISYNLGLTKIVKDADSGGKNRVFAITVGWRF